MKKHQIFAHRGFHQSQKDEENTLGALLESLNRGYSIETDLRDFKTLPFVSHDPIAEGLLPFETLLASVSKIKSSSTQLALNIKSDGLASHVSRLIYKYFGNDSSRFFIFDGSVPDSLQYIHHQLSVYTRLSEYETTPAFDKLCSGFWIDNFEGSYDQLKAAQQIHESHPTSSCVLVSPELHGRDRSFCWNALKSSRIFHDTSFGLCTDFPNEAYLFFNS